MASDRDLVSKEDHEINYLLQKWEKKQNKANREIVVEELSKFKKDDEYKPHNRENFYKYIEDKKIKTKLEAADKKDEKATEKKVEKTEKKEEAKKEVKKEPVKKAKSVEKKQKTSGSKIKIKLIKSPFGYKKDQIGTVRALGLRKMNQVKEHTDSQVLRGMIFKVKHLVEVVK